MAIVVPRAAVEVGEQVEHLDLVGDVEEGRRLVEQEDVGALRERHRDPHPLPLTAGELVDGAVGEVGSAGEIERLGDRRVVLAGPPRQHLLVRAAAAGDEVGDDDPLGRDRRLREQPEQAGHLLRRALVQRLAVEHDLAGRRREEAGERAQQRRLAARVGADDDGDLPRLHLQVEVGDDGALAVAERDVLGRERMGMSHNEPPERFERMRR